MSNTSKNNKNVNDPIVKGGQGRTEQELIDDTRICAVCAVMIVIFLVSIAVYTFIQ